MNKNKQEALKESEIKNMMLDFSEVDPNSPESIRKYGERCMIIGVLYNGYIKNIDRKFMGKEVESILSRNKEANYSEEVKEIIKNVERLSNYKNEYIG